MQKIKEKRMREKCELKEWFGQRGRQTCEERVCVSVLWYLRRKGDCVYLNIEKSGRRER